MKFCGHCITEGPTLLVENIYTGNGVNYGPLHLCAVCLYAYRTTGKLPAISTGVIPTGRGAYKPRLDEIDKGWGKK
mgnify:CR=1 FL=1